MKCLYLLSSLALALSITSAAAAADNAPQRRSASEAVDVSSRDATWITLGTGGGPLLRQKRSEPANALVVNGTAYLFDVGEGTLHRLTAAALNPRQVKAVFISHHHVDHDAGLAAFLWYRWQGKTAEPLQVIGPNGTRAMVTGLLQAGRAMELSPVVQDGTPRGALADSAAGQDLPMDTPRPVEIYRDANIRVSAVINAHYHFPAGSLPARLSRSYAYRIETADGRSFVYTGDTGPSPAVTALAHGADVLVSEVMDPVAMQAVADRGNVDADAFMRHMMEDHLTPDEVGRMAAEAGVKQVVLTHVVPGFDRESSTEAYAAQVRARFHGPVAVAADLQRF